jgi:hypothetical protein
MKENEGYVILQQAIGEKSFPHIPAGWHIEGTPQAVYQDRRWAMHYLYERIKKEKQKILWIDRFNGSWPTYHTVYTLPSGKQYYYFWYIYH